MNRETGTGTQFPFFTSQRSTRISLEVLKGVIIEGSNIRSKSQKHSFVKVDSAGAFKMDLLPEGNYVLKAFEDRNGNGIDDAGSVFPFRRSEQFRYYPDTIRVRPRWPVDGVILR